MKIDLKNLDTYHFVIYVLIFVLLFCLIFTMQMRSVINFQNKMLSKWLEGDKVITQPVNTYTNKYDTTPATMTDKYKNYDY